MPFLTDILDKNKEEEDFSILNTILTPITSLLTVLDTPGGFARGLLSGQPIEENLSAILNPEKRATGRDVLTNFGIEGGKIGDFDAAGIATEILTDPLIATSSVFGLTRAGKAAARISKATEDLAFAEKRIKLGLDQAKVSAGLVGKKLGLDSDEIINIMKKNIADDSDLQAAILSKKFSADTIKSLTAEGFTAKAPTRMEQILAGQRGIEVGFGKYKYAPTFLNHLVGPAIAKTGDILEAGTKFISSKTPLLKKLFSTKQAHPLLDQLHEFEKWSANKTLIDIGDDPLLTRDWQAAQKQAGLSDEEFTKVVLGGQENYKVVETADNEFKRYLTQETDLLQKNLENTRLRYQEQINVLPPTATQEDILKINTTRNKVLASMKTKFFKRLIKKEAKVEAVKNRAIRATGAVDRAGELPKQLVESFNLQKQERLAMVKAANLFVNELDDWGVSYARRVLTPKGREYYDTNKQVFNFVNNKISTDVGFLKKRKFREMDTPEVNEFMRKKYNLDFDVFQTDPRVANRDQKYFMEQAVQRSRNVSIAIDQLAQPITSFNANSKLVHIGQVIKDSKLRGFKRVTFGKNERVESIIRKLDKQGFDLYLPQEVYADLTKVNKFNWGSVEKIMDKIDAVNAIWRAGITLHPGYTGTNILGDTQTKLIAGTSFRPGLLVDVRDAFNRGFAKNRAAKDFVQAEGLKGTPGKYDQYFKLYEIFSGNKLNSIADVIQDMMQSKNKVVKGISESKVFKWANNVNQYVEEISRFHMFADYLDKGYSPLEAGRLVKKYLFDYSDLTSFEQKVMKKFFLFYTFMRKNLPLAISETVANRRAYVVGKTVQGSLKNQEFVPEYVKEQGNLAIGPGQFIDLKIPLFEANRFSPQGAGIQRVVEKILAQSGPSTKIPAELFSGRETFRGRPFEELNKVRPSFGGLPGVTTVETRSGPEYRVNSLLFQLAKNLPTTRYQQTIDDLLNPEVNFPLSLVGIRKRSIAPEKARLQALKAQLERQISENPEIRTFKQPFSISKKPREDTVKLLNKLREVNEEYKKINR